MSKLEFIDAEIQTGWVQKWASPSRLHKKGLIKIREVVPGPFCSPRLLNTQPYALLSPCPVRNKEKLCVQPRQGIPDTWAEYLASTRFCGLKDNQYLQKGMVQCCIRCHITDALWNELGIPFVQGIPDPSKHPCPQARPVEHLGRYTCARKKRARKAPITRKTQTDNGTAAGEKEKDQLWEGHVSSVGRTKDRKNVPRKIDMSGLSGEIKGGYKEYKRLKTVRHRLPDKTKIEEDAFNSGKRVLKKLQKNLGTEVNETNLFNEMKDKISPKSIGQEMLAKFKDNITVTVNEDPTQQRRKNKPNHTNNQTAVVTEMKKATQKIWPTNGEYKRDEASRPVGETKGHFVENEHLQLMNCNCILPAPYCIIPARDYFDYYINRFKGGDITGRVLCADCERAYRSISKRSSENLKGNCPRSCGLNKHTEKKPSGSQEKFYARYKQKACQCLQKARQKFQGQKDSAKQTNVKSSKRAESPRRRLKMVCCQCDCSYLKIALANYDSGNSDQEEDRFCTCRQQNQSRNSRTADNISRNLSTGRPARNSVSYGCVHLPSKSHIPNQTPQGVSRLKKAKSGNRQSMEINRPGKNPGNLNDAVNEGRKKDNRRISQSSDQVRSFPSPRKEVRGIRGDSYREKTFANGYRDRAREKKVESNDVSDSEGGSNRVKYLQRSRSDKRPEYVESDSGEHADISDTSKDFNINVTACERSAVTSASGVRCPSRENEIRAVCVKKSFGKTGDRGEQSKILRESSDRLSDSCAKECGFSCSNFSVHEVEAAARVTRLGNCDGKGFARGSSPDRSDGASNSEEFSHDRFAADINEQRDGESRESVAKSTTGHPEKISDQRLIEDGVGSASESIGSRERSERFDCEKSESVSQLFSRRRNQRQSANTDIYATNDFPCLPNDKLRVVNDKQQSIVFTKPDSYRGHVEYSRSTKNVHSIEPRMKERTISNGNYDRSARNVNANEAIEVGLNKSSYKGTEHNAPIEQSHAQSDPRTGDIKAGRVFTYANVPASNDSRFKDGNVNDKEARSPQFFNERVSKATDTLEIPLTPGPCVARHTRPRSRNASEVTKGSGIGDKENVTGRNLPGLLPEEEYLECFLNRERGMHGSVVSVSKSDNQLNVPRQWCKNEKQPFTGNKEARKNEAEGRLFTGNFRCFERPRLSSDSPELYSTEYGLNITANAKS